MSRSLKKAVIDDGMNSELVETAFFDGLLEMPAINPPREIIIPKGMIPFSQREKTADFSDTVVFHEHDVKFRDILIAPDDFVEDIGRFKGGMTSPDNSLYWDMPLVAQMANVYRNRAIGHYFQTKGIPVITTVRWGDERSYTTKYLPERFAFLGAPRHSIVSVGTYGCISDREAKCHMEAGFEAMLETLEPKVVLIYGSMPRDIFGRFENATKLVAYPDWITLRKGGKSNGDD